MALSQRALGILTRLAKAGDVVAQACLEGMKGEVGSGVKYEVILKNPAAASATNAVAATASNAANALVIAAQPDFPRNVMATFQALYDGGDITITGIDHTGAPVTEVLTANAGGTRSGTVAWKSIKTITKGAVGATTNTVSLGYQNAFGVGAKPITELSPPEFVGGVAEAASAVDLTKGTVTPTTAPNGANDYLISATKA